MNLRHLEYVVAVADSGSFSAAAEALFVTQPTLSEGVATLERGLGVTLFRRDVRPVAPTDAGRAVIAEARHVLRGAERVHEVVADVAGVRTGVLRIGAPGQAAAYALADPIAAFARSHPGIQIRIAAPDDVGDVAALVGGARCDLGITFRPVPDSLRAVPFGSVDFVLVCPPGTELPDAPVPLDRLPAPLIVPVDLTTVDSEFRRLGRHPTDAPVAVVAEVRELIVPLVLAGVGVTLLPTGLARAAEAQGAVVAPVDPPITLPLSLVHRPDDLSPAAAAFLALVP
jgi:LysR family transcriptional regulator, carnitine catabolism transcriptional activator